MIGRIIENESMLPLGLLFALPTRTARVQPAAARRRVSIGTLEAA